MADTTASHDATPRRLRQAREAGRTAHSQDLASAVLLLGGLAALLFGGASLVEFLAEFIQSGLSGGAWKAWLDSGDAPKRLIVAEWHALAGALARLLAPILAAATLLAIAAHMIQTGWLFRPQQVAPDLSRASPLGGLRRIFSGASAARLALGVVKVGVVAAIALAALWSRREALASLAALDPARLAAQAWDICFWTSLEIGGALLALALVDYAYQRWQLARDLRMTPREMRDETRELEGDPRQRSRRREVAHKRSVARATDTTAVRRS
jgi:flagellar biosynthetic protein FlhB